VNFIQGAGSIIPILCFILLSPDTPSTVSWSSIGSGGAGWISAITVVNDDAHTVYVGCDVGGIYKSTDRGLTWEIKNTGLSTYYVQDIEYDPSAPSTLYAGTRGGVFKSIDGGDTWVSKRSNFPDESAYNFSAPVSDIVVDPADPSIIYAGIGVPRTGYELDEFYWKTSGVKGTIYKSDDSGESWSLIHDTGINPEAMIYSLAIEPGNSNTIYAATSIGVYKSTNAGATWISKNTNLPLHLLAMTLVIDPIHTETLYVTMWAEPDPALPPWKGGVYKSTDGGGNWGAMNNGLPQVMGAEVGLTSNYAPLVIDKDNPQILYTGNNPWTPDPGVYKTIDGGKNWVWVSRFDSSVPEQDNVTIGWIAQHGVSVKALAIDPSDAERLYFGTSTHLLTTENAGETWNQAYGDEISAGYWKGRGLETSVVQDIAVDPKNSDNIYAGYWDMGFLKSTDGGVSFKKTFNGMTYHSNTFSIIVDPSGDASTIYAATGWWEEAKGEVVKSTDFGENWTIISNGLPDDATIWSIALDMKSPINSRIMYAACHGKGVYKTTDGGLNWLAVNTGLGVDGNLQVRKIVVDPNDSDILYAGIEAKLIEDGDDLDTVQGGLFKSTDGGEHWARIDTSIRQLSVWDIDVVPGDSQIIYTAVSSEYDHTLKIDYAGGVYKSSNGGNSWIKMNAGFGSEENLDVLSIAINPANTNTVYAVTSDAPFHDQSSGRGVFKSTDAGSNWVIISDESKILNFDSITIDPSNPSLLYVGSGGNGILKGIDPAVAH